MALKHLCPGTTRLMAVVKANACGHGAVEVARKAIASGADFLAVARISEAVELRSAGILSPILLFGDVNTDHLAYIADKDIRITLSSVKDAQKVSDQAVKKAIAVKVHIKVDTGMGRLGLYVESKDGTGSVFTDTSHTADKIMEMRALGGVDVEGVYTHFANADALDKQHASEQLSVFTDLLAKLEQKGFKPAICHAANSAATIDMPGAHFDMIRPGISLYGLWPSDEVDQSKVELKPAMSILSKIIHLKTVPAGFKISYGSTYRTTRSSLIATVPIGYADGYSRGLSSKGVMIVRGIRTPVIGRVCMDFTMIDVSKVTHAVVGDDVVVMGCQSGACVTADEIARLTGTINYEVASSLTRRMPVTYINTED